MIIGNQDMTCVGGGGGGEGTVFEMGSGYIVCTTTWIKWLGTMSNFHFLYLNLLNLHQS